VTEDVPGKSGEYPGDNPQFSNPACYEKYLKDNKHGSPVFDLKNMLGYLSLDIICSSKLTVSLSFAHRRLFSSWNR